MVASLTMTSQPAGHAEHMPDEHTPTDVIDLDEKGGPWPQQLKAARKAKRLTQTQLGELVGTKGFRAVAHWEAGDYAPKAEKRPALARALGVRIKGVSVEDFEGRGAEILPLNLPAATDNESLRRQLLQAQALINNVLMQLDAQART